MKKVTTMYLINIYSLYKYMCGVCAYMYIPFSLTHTLPYPTLPYPTQAVLRGLTSLPIIIKGVLAHTRAHAHTRTCIRAHARANTNTHTTHIHRF